MSAVGDELPAFELEVTATVIVAGAIASRDFMPVHHDRDYARAQGAPDLFMNIFSREHEGLALLGLSNVGGPSFPLYDDQARAVIVALTLRELGGVDWRAWRSVLTTSPDLRGGARFTNTLANALTVDDHMYSTRLRDLCDRFGYTPGGSWAGNIVEPPPPPGLGAALRESLR